MRPTLTLRQKLNAPPSHFAHPPFGPLFMFARPTIAAFALALAAGAVAVPAFALGSSGGGPARAARTLQLQESANLHLTSKHGFTLNEQGQASGTARGAIYVHLTIVSSSRVNAEINLYPSGGSISSRGSAAYHRGRTSASFAGSLSIEHGSGSYSRARGSGLSFSGTIQRSNDAVTVHVSGRVED